MKTITLNSDNRSIILCNDADVLSVASDHVRRNDERIYGVGASSVTLREAPDAPDDWSPSKYFFDGSIWTANADWIDPETLALE